jgi:ribosomal protein S18 acetylase RimI-like enzyme
MHIRELTEGDAEAYRPLRLRALRERPDAFGSSYEEAVSRPIEATWQRLHEQSPAEGSFILGAFDLGAFDDGGVLVGTMGLLREQGMKTRHKATVWGAYVAPEARGQGVGKALLRELIARARNVAGIEQVLLAVTMHNAEARGLYLACGFTVYGTEPRALRLPDGRYLDEDLLVLRFEPSEIAADEDAK